MTHSSSPVSANASGVLRWRLWTIWLVLILIGLASEYPAWSTSAARNERLSGMLCGMRADWLPALLWLLVAPLFVSLATSQTRPRTERRGRLSRWLELSAADGEFDLGTVCATLVLGLLGWWMTVRVGDEFDGAPPAYHDEYSYRLQAETFRDGRTWYPVHTQLPQLFDQMHVLNEPDMDPPRGRFAGRYFPGTALWMVPFVDSEQPAAGHQLAQVFLVIGIFWIGRELSSNGVGLLAAVLTATSPGLLLFSNLLLAHHPTLVGLTLFLWMYIRARRTASGLSCFLAGVGLAFAMLCRPMTAAGVSLPAGVVFGWWWLTGRGDWIAARQSFARRSLYAVALGGPLVAGAAGMLWYQQSVTGQLTISPYQIYTDRYTPRHVYGFNNGVRGDQHLGPKVIENYNNWAENLTPQLAARNVGVRLISSWRWTLGILPLLSVALTWCLLPDVRKGKNWWVVWSALIGLHVAHIPYWFTGIMDWHYVFETAPLWLLVAAAAFRGIVQIPGLRWWTFGLIALSMSVNLWTCEPLWFARVDVGVSELLLPRLRYAQFRQQIEQYRRGRDILVLVIPDPADRSMDYVTNPANLSGPVLVGRWRGESLTEIRAAFPARTLIQYDAHSRQFSAIESSRP